ncbi:MAG TPA: CBS domain-containing protein [Candidatus Binatus sp.]|nr:CBS domain-containing protein [Candidatus Binatus sp.]
MIDYRPGKVAWYEENEPREGKAATDETWIGDVADSEVPTCGLKERIEDIRRRTAGWDTCVVVTPERVVLGLLRKKELEGDPNATAEQVMRPGPKTFRPNVTLEELLKSMRDHDIQTNSLVTTGEGKLLGVISRADAEATLAHEAAAETRADR